LSRGGSSFSAWTILLLTTLSATPALLVFSMLAGESLWPESWTSLLALAVLTQVIGQVLLVAALAKVEPIVIGVALLTQPVIGGAIGWLGFGEILNTIDIFGMALISLAIIIVAYQPRTLVMERVDRSQNLG
ncbi:MAG: DMT family transporter, partial [Mesorhizobium sp.]|nr:DMT family transporter [Mesorhizobium sp.]